MKIVYIANSTIPSTSANSVVVKDVEENSFYAGNPGKIIKKLEDIQDV